MQKLMAKLPLMAASFFLFTGVLSSCKKDSPEEMLYPTTEEYGRRVKTTTTTPTTTTPTTSTYSLLVNWNNSLNTTYGYAQAALDFTNTIYWDAYSSATTGGMLQTTLAKNVVGPSGGVMSRMDVPDAAAYQMQFDMMFDSQFDWSAGGKVGFGFLIGEGYTGGGTATDGNGGSARLMWEQNSSGRVYLKPYLYYKDQPGTWGDNMGKTYPATGSIQKGQWYTVNMYVKSNTGFNTDGRIQMIINGTVVIDQAIRWTTNDLKRLINKVCFENFRGGSETYWQSSTDGHIYFDNVSWSAL